LKQAKGICYVAIESVYSMDGDTPPIEAILALCENYGANLVVDEAHAIGLYKFGLIDENLQNRIFAKIVTFGKALGCHGAVVLGSGLLREYLINFSRSFIYTTALPVHQIVAIKMSYELLINADAEVDLLKNNIELFKENIKFKDQANLIASDSAIQCILLSDNNKAKETAAVLQNSGFDVRAILSPTVPAGSERIRICLHSFNTENEIIALTNILNDLINAG
jgi:8-amino-7-oxononanoate synthase